MKNIRRYLGLTLLMFAVVAMSSCIKENLSEKSDKVDVTLSFNARAGEAENESEGIKTLRVIISDESDNIVYRFFQDYNDNQTTKTLQIMGMKTGSWNFYAIINEASLGLTEGDFSGVTKGSDLLEIAVENEGQIIYFPKSGENITEAIPASGYLQNVQINEENKNLTINCTYAVAKIILNIQNNSGMDFTLNRVSFGEIFQQGTFLFNKNGELPSTSPKALADGFNMSKKVIPAGDNTEALVCYLFETGSQPLENGFTLALESDEIPDLGVSHKITVNSTENYTPYTLPRGYKMQINAVVNIGQQINPTFNVEVLSWDKKTINIPEFN